MTVSRSATHRRYPMSRAYSTKYAAYWQRITPSDGCWECHSSLNVGGYPRARVNGEEWLLHRLAWTLFYAPIPESIYVCHKCDNRRCARPDHLFLGTHKENMVDSVQKKRSKRFHTHCIRGHEYTPGNTMWGKFGDYQRRSCRICKRWREKRNRRIRKERKNI